MAEKYQQFLEFDWSHSGWHEYLEGLYPQPDPKKLVKFKKKWYKKNVDPDFDDSYEPPGAKATDGPSSAGKREVPELVAGITDGSRWKKLSKKATICFTVYTIALVFTIAAAAGIFPTYQALLVLIAAFFLEILAKYGLKIDSAYLYNVLLDDVGPLPIMMVTQLTPGAHPCIRVVALISPFLTAFLSYCQICKAHAKIPKLIRDFFSPVADMAARYKVMQVRADVEVVLGVVLVLGALTMRAAPISVLLYWNVMMMRYMMNPFTQATFRKTDEVLNPVLSKVPGISQGYSGTKRAMYGFVDPKSKKSGKLCSIM